MSICPLILTVLWTSKICVCEVTHSRHSTHTHFLTFMSPYAVRILRNLNCTVYTHIHKHTPSAEALLALFKLKSHYNCNSLPQT